MPFLSVIIPVYNVEDYITQCFESLVCQVNEDVEIICIDDGSTDNSGMICDLYAKKYSNIYVLHTENKGVAAARNIGLEQAKGEYIAWIDPDDYVIENWYYKIKETLTHFVCDILIFNYKIEKNNKLINKKYKNENGYIDKIVFLRDVVIDVKIQSQLWHKVFRRKLVKNIKFIEEYSCMEDYDWLHKIIEISKGIYYIKDFLYVYRIRNNGLVKNIDLCKSWSCYLIAIRRYIYLSSKYEEVSRAGYLLQATYYCINCHRLKKYDSKYFFLKNVIKNNIYYTSIKEIGVYNFMKILLIVIDCKKLIRIILKK